MAQQAVPKVGSGHAWAGLNGKDSALSPGGSTGPRGVGFQAFARWSGINPSKTRRRGLETPFGRLWSQNLELGRYHHWERGDLRPGRYHWIRERQVVAREYRGLRGGGLRK